MNNEKMKEIERLMNIYKDEVDISGEVEEKIINEMEKTIGLKLPEEYKQYIKKFGSRGICGVDILGIEMYAINNKIDTSIVSHLEIWRRRGLEEKYIPVKHVDEFAYIVDGTDEKSPVYVYFFDSLGSIEKRFESFFDFVLDQMAEAIDNL